MQRFFPVQTKAVHGLLRRFLESPDDFMAHIKHMAATIILTVAYGLEIQSKDDPLIKLSDDAVKPASDAGRPGEYLVVSVSVSYASINNPIPSSGRDRAIEVYS